MECGEVGDALWVAFKAPAPDLALTSGVEVQDPSVPSGVADLAMKGKLEIVRSIAAGLSRLHSAGLIHGSVNPRSVRVTFKDGLPDPIAELAPSERPFSQEAWRKGHAEHHPPADGLVLGFTAPETLGGRLLPSPATDIFGLAATTYFIIAGRLPFLCSDLRGSECPTEEFIASIGGRSGLVDGINSLLRWLLRAMPETEEARRGAEWREALRNTLAGHHHPLSELNPEVPPELSGLISRCLSSDVEKRPGSIEEFLAALEPS